MPRRKSLLAQMCAEHQKAKRERQRAEDQAQRAWDAEMRKTTAQMEREAAQERRDAERAAQVQQRAADQAERARQQAVAKAGREAAARARAEQREQAAAVREQQRRAAEDRRLAAQQRLDEADSRTEAVSREVAALERVLADRNRDLATWNRRAEDVFNVDGPQAFADVLAQALAVSVYPDGLHGSCAATYHPEARELWVEYELPRQEVIPPVLGYRYQKTKDVIQAIPRKDAEIKKLYGQLLARATLRTLAEAFAAAPATLVAGIVFNGYISAKDRTTGQSIRPLLISTHAMREAFDKIMLDEPELDPKACLRGYLNAIVSAHPYDLEPVEPVLRFDLSRYKTVEGTDVVAGLDHRTDLLALKPEEFEHLIRQLFEARGLKSWVTQTSRDDGVDGIATNEDPIVGGLCIIQAKRYSRIVGLEAVHALAGVMEDMHAAKGVLVTTSWVGKASRDFAARNGKRIEIIEGRELKNLLQKYLRIDVLISLPKLPPNWERHDIT